jgi:hypothetical protein
MDGKKKGGLGRGVARRRARRMRGLCLSVSGLCRALCLGDSARHVSMSACEVCAPLPCCPTAAQLLNQKTSTRVGSWSREVADQKPTPLLAAVV